MDTLVREKERIVAPTVTSNGHAPKVAALEVPVARPDGRVKGAMAFGVLRIFMGCVFLWAFLDKLLALGFSTGRNADTGAIDFFGPDAWINGGSPTDGVLQFALVGPFKGLYDGLAGQVWVEWVYMLSMLLIGTALILGVATRLAAIGGIIWMTIFYTATAIWPEHNPFLDDHVVYAVLLGVLAVVGAGRYLGFGERYERLGIVKRFPILK